ncbi:hypothetical protein ABFV80_002324 [Vandammella animalimorsus]|uniref:hypothetical protein n=1 Tax=Vandammella animalimorsus TaxID=2029117 RepID=UPI00325B5568
MDKEQPGVDPRDLSVGDRTLWLIDRLEQVEDLLMGVSDVQKLLVAVLPDGPERERLRAGLIGLAMSLPQGTLRTRPIWGALGLLDTGDDDG